MRCHLLLRLVYAVSQLVRRIEEGLQCFFRRPVLRKLTINRHLVARVGSERHHEPNMQIGEDGDNDAAPKSRDSYCALASVKNCTPRLSATGRLPRPHRPGDTTTLREGAERFSLHGRHSQEETSPYQGNAGVNHERVQPTSACGT